MSEDNNRPTPQPSGEWSRSDYAEAYSDLERQLAEAQHQVEKYAAEAKSAIEENERLFRELAEAQEERDTLAEACQQLLEKCDDSDDARYGTLSTTFVRDHCKQALATLNPETPTP